MESAYHGPGGADDANPGSTFSADPTARGIGPVNRVWQPPQKGVLYEAGAGVGEHPDRSR